MKKGQITIFIILGVVILFIGILMFQLASKTKVGGLKEEREKVVEGSFKKEGLRLYVEDCLNDELEKGLVILGRQGRIWKGQEGGRTSFVERWTGVTLNGVNLSYGIVFDQKKYLPPNKYPCERGEPPDFCRYKYPNSSIIPNYPVKFGGRQLDIKSMERDLKNFLINRTIWCVENFTKANISPAVKVSTENLVMNLDILDEGINVKVEYPLTLSLAGEDFFHLAKFDFFYPTKFKRLLEAAVTYPLKLDWSFVDFNYSEDSLKKESFVTAQGTEREKQYLMRKDEYKKLRVEFNNEPLGEGDDLFQFTVNEGIITNGSYTFQFVRQNRPPALDYIERDACDEEGYDYLVIPGKEGLGEVNINLSAWDPDEDEVIYEVNDTQLPGNLQGNNFKASSLTPGYYNITAIATDGYLSDWQRVRILVDRIMKMNISLGLPYPVRNVWGDIFVVSNEDPVFIKVTLPENSLTTNIPKAIYLNYSSSVENFALGLSNYQAIAGKETCYGLPGGRPCNISSYNEKSLKNWKDDLNTDLDFGHFKNLTFPRNPGKLNLTLAMTYCEKNNQSDSKEVKVIVKECIPYKNPRHPYPYMLGDKDEYYKHIFMQNEEGVWVDSNETEEINPFLATHACCLGNESLPFTWRLAGNNVVCFDDPVPGCYGGTTLPGPNYDLRGKKGEILEQRERYCDNKRGNICQGDWSYKIISDQLGKAICGDEEKYPECNNNLIAKKCRGKPAWSIMEEEGVQYWCYGGIGNAGCEKVCDDTVVDNNGEGILGEGDECRKCNNNDVGVNRKCWNLKIGREGTCQQKDEEFFCE